MYTLEIYDSDFLPLLHVSNIIWLNFFYFSDELQVSYLSQDSNKLIVEFFPVSSKVVFQ